VAALPLASASESGGASEPYRARVAAADFEQEQQRHWPPHAANGDEKDVADFAAVYSKTLPHDRLGVVKPEAYALLLRALSTRDPRDFEFVPTVGTAKLANPQAAFAVNLIGPDPQAVPCPPPPRFNSAGQAAEMVELYWQALTRDISFSRYNSDPLITRAAEELGRLSGARVTPATLFRAANAGSLAGPYVSQFLLREILYAPLPVEQKIRTAPAGRDYLLDYDRWLDSQDGVAQSASALEINRCFVRNGRDLAEYVHRDFIYQGALSAGLILLDMGAPLNPGNPYKRSRGEAGFATFGAPYLLYLIATATHAALTACWYQKWMVHRRLRPEELGGRVVNHLAGRAKYPFHSSLLDSAALAETQRRHATSLLSSSYAEGCPTHPAYPAGHAVVSAAGITVLKAFFDESFVMPQPVMPSADGRSLERYAGPPLTLGGELDKLSGNIGMGRNFAGIHWRSDIEAGMRLGEEVAICVLREMQLAAHEPFSGFRFHRINGQPVTA
jgi:hypothetical protein